MARGKRVEIVKIIVDGVEVDAKECTKCGEVKALQDYKRNNKGAGEREARCKECARKPGAKRISPMNKWSPQSYREHVQSVTNGEYEVIGDYKKNDTKIIHTHKTCGNSWMARPCNFLRGSRCPFCAGNVRKSTEQFQKEVHYLTGEEYSVVGEYQSNNKHIEMRHNHCGEIYFVLPTHFLRGVRCPRCNESKGERAIREYLIAKGYAYTSQYKMEGCYNKRPLPFDFALHLNGLIVAIEYDGEQHFHPINFGGEGGQISVERHLRTKRNDRIKNEYCRANGIPLIRIRYDQYDEIEEILTRELTKLGVTGKRPIAQETEEATAA